MTRDEAMRLAEQAGVEKWWNEANADQRSYEDAILRLVALAVTAEREACASACEDMRGTVSMFATSKDCRTHNNAITCCVKAISARGDT